MRQHFWKYTHTTRGTRQGESVEVMHYTCMDCGATKTKAAVDPQAAKERKAGYKSVVESLIAARQAGRI